MGSSLGPVLANIIMTEIEDVTIKLLLLMVQSSFIVALLMAHYW